jgi:hypothetical protein
LNELQAITNGSKPEGSTPLTPKPCRTSLHFFGIHIGNTSQIIVVFLSSSKQLPGQQLSLGHGFLARP